MGSVSLQNPGSNKLALTIILLPFKLFHFPQNYLLVFKTLKVFHSEKKIYSTL